MSESSSYFDLAGRIADSFEEIENDITVGLRKSNEEYYSLYQSISDLKVKNPFIQNVIEGTGGLTPVSYTHLDVYKRQVWLCKYRETDRRRTYRE